MAIYNELYGVEPTDKKLENLKLSNDTYKEYIDGIINKKIYNIFSDEEILYDVAQLIDNLYLKKGEEFRNVLDFEADKKLMVATEKTFHMMVHNPYDVIEIRDFFKFLSELMSEPLFVKIINSDENFNALNMSYNLFNTKVDTETYSRNYNVDIWINIIRQIYDNISSSPYNEPKKASHYFKLIINYMLIVRTYYASEGSFHAEVMTFLSAIKQVINIEDLKSVLEEQLTKVEKINGVYNYGDLDFVRLQIYTDDLNEANKTLEGSEKKLSNVSAEINSLENEIIKSETKIEIIKNNIINDIKKDVDKYIEIKKLNQEKEIDKQWKLFRTAVSMVASELQTKNIVVKEEHSHKNHNIPSHADTNKKIEKEPIKKTESNIIDTGDCIRYFDSRYSLKNRLNYILKEKKSNQLYHKNFDQVMKNVLNNNLVYLVGQSGSGKTFLAYQIAEALDLPLYNIGYVVDEFLSIKGAMDANGNFIETPFYKAFKYGGICFFDEIDNSESKALIELNKIVGTNGYQPYLFGNGELVYPHPNFRIIAAGNTWGDGATLLNNTREKLDEATINRFTSIWIDYDQQLEKTIMKNYPEYYSALVQIRSYYRDHKFPYLITTRVMSEIAHDLDTGCYTLEELLETRIIRNKSNDTIEPIIEYLDNKSTKNFAKSLRKCLK